jgi:hypothetical protein
LFWIALMRDGGKPAVITRWREVVEKLPEARCRADLGRIALIFAELAGCYLAWEKGLEGLNVTESQVVNRWIAQAQTEAKLERGRADVVRILEKRFAGQITAAIVATINAQPSLALLDEWMDAAITATTLEQFLAVVRQ